MDNSLIGKRFGTLKVIRLFGVLEEDHKKYWVCLCDCGNYRVADYKSLIKRDTITCGNHIGPISKDKTRFRIHKTTEYGSWIHMKGRCNNPKDDSYKNYGGRGIKVCERWLNSFENFLSDMGKKPTPKHSVDRIDVNGDYEPSNCRWATMKEQQNNRRNNRKTEVRGLRLG